MEINFFKNFSKFTVIVALVHVLNCGKLTKCVSIDLTKGAQLQRTKTGCETYLGTKEIPSYIKALRLSRVSQNHPFVALCGHGKM